MLWYTAGARVKGESPPRRPSDTAWESYLGVVPPTRCAGAVREDRCQLHDTVPLTPVPRPRHTPRRRMVEPSKGVRLPTPHPPRTASWRQWKDLVMPRGGWIGSLQILKQMQQLKDLSVLPTWCRNYRRGRYFQYQVGTTDRIELTKKKFEFSSYYSNYIWNKVLV
jgi:hypothetical protein